MGAEPLKQPWGYLFPTTDILAEAKCALRKNSYNRVSHYIALVFSSTHLLTKPPNPGEQVTLADMVSWELLNDVKMFTNGVILADLAIRCDDIDWRGDVYRRGDIN